MDKAPSSTVINKEASLEDDALIDPLFSLEDCEPNTQMNMTRGGRSIKPTQKFRNWSGQRLKEEGSMFQEDTVTITTNLCLLCFAFSLMSYLRSR